MPTGEIMLVPEDNTRRDLQAISLGEIDRICMQFERTRSATSSVSQIADILKPYEAEGFNILPLISELIATELELFWRRWSRQEFRSLGVSAIQERLRQVPSPRDYLEALVSHDVANELETQLRQQEFLCRCRFGDLPSPEQMGIPQTHAVVRRIEHLRPLVSVSREEKLFFKSPCWGTLTIGRQASYAEAFPSLTMGKRNKLTIAPANETRTSREQCKLQFVTPELVIVENGSRAINVLVDFKHHLESGESRLTSLPFHMNVENIEVSFSHEGQKRRAR